MPEFIFAHKQKVDYGGYCFSFHYFLLIFVDLQQLIVKRNIE